MNKKVIMLASSGRGGILSVIEAYRQDGLFERWNVQFIASHQEGTFLTKLSRAALAYFQVLVLTISGRIALLHAHLAMNGSFWRKIIFALIVRCFRIPVVLHLHAGHTRSFFQNLPEWARKFVLAQLNAASAVVVLSDSWRSFVKEIAPQARVLVLPNYVHLPLLPVKRKESSTVLKILFLGLIGENKGIYDLLTAFSKQLSNHPAWLLQIGGNGELDAAREFAKNLGLTDQVQFLGWVSGDQKNKVFREADIFVLPSYNEGLPVSVLEAMSWAIPVVTTPVGGVPELIQDQVNGLLIEPGDIPALGQALTRLADDPVLRQSVGRQARTTIENRYAKEVTLPRLEALYSELILKPN